MKIVTWNVNSVRARLDRVLELLRGENPDVVCLQETKVTDPEFPREPLEELGYRIEIHGQKTYNGVALLARGPITDVVQGLPGAPDDAQARFLAATVGGIRVVNVYVPNGSEVGSEKYAYKMEWLGRLRRWLQEQAQPSRPLLICGDFNIAPEDRDVHDPEKWREAIMCSTREREMLSELCAWGLQDAFRLLNQEAGHHTWWDYRGGAFHRGWGLRIDYFLVTRPLAQRTEAVETALAYRKGPRPSDHAPVVATFRDG